VLLEVSQLLTTVASPVPPVEEEHGGGAAEPVRYAECAAVYGTPLKLGEALPDTKSFHDDDPSSGADSSVPQPSPVHPGMDIKVGSAVGGWQLAGMTGDFRPFASLRVTRTGMPLG
jgi:hypothetical protein